MRKPLTKKEIAEAEKMPMAPSFKRILIDRRADKNKWSK